MPTRSNMEKLDFMQSLTLIKIEVQLLGNVLILWMHLHADAPNFTLCAIVQFAIIEDKLHIVHEVLDSLILMLLQFCADSWKVHWICHNGWVVENVQLDVVDRIGEDVCFLVAGEGHQHAWGSLLPLIHDWSTFWDLRHLKLTDWLNITLILIGFKVGS